MEFEAPFEPFVHRWSKLLEYKDRKDIDNVTEEHLELLYDVLKVELEAVLKNFEDYVEMGVTTYDNLWTIFQPGGLIYSGSHGGATGAFQLASGKYVELSCGGFAYELTADCIDWNGSHFGRSSQKLYIPEFIGTAKILGLRAFPLSFHPSKDEVSELLVKRGQKFEGLAGCHFKKYNGYAITWDREGKETPTYCSGRVVIDSNTFRNYAPRYVAGIEALAAKEGASEPESDTTSDDDQSDENYIFGKGTETKRLRLTKGLQLTCSSRVRGYSLTKKEWLIFYVDLVEDIKFNDNAFESLVLPEDQKELILSFAEAQTMENSSFDDVVAGKGKGFVTLLSGPPGVGKTLTAESVAEHMHAPLYMMSSGDLGSRPDQVEHRLRNVLEMIAKWNAVLLLDECDVFLEKRSTHDLERNKLVSIFLRTLEYYEGILFLTTNRIDNIDTAFQSRIHVSLAYPDLSPESRRHIWVNFTKQLNMQGWDERDLDEVAEIELNGRQIKNVLKSAALLSARKKEPLGRKYIDMVLAIEKRRPGVAGGF